MSSGIIQTIIQTSDLFFEITSNQTNLDIRTLIGDTLFNAAYRKRVIIPSSVTVGSATTTSAAVQIPTGLGGSLFIDNYGSIQGAGGAAGGNGGDAILVQSTCTIENKPTGTIYAGGGGGGTGGTGGKGGDGVVTSPPVTIFNTNPCGCRFGTFTPPSQCSPGYPTLVACNPAPAACPPTRRGNTYCSATIPGPSTPTTGGAGGAGGIGGVGRGYNQAPTTGSAGAAGSAGGTNAGTGGTGGTGGAGGDWGTPGSFGSTGGTGSNGNSYPGLPGSLGSAGGNAGYYINGSPLTTFINTGSIAGSII